LFIRNCPGCLSGSAVFIKRFGEILSGFSGLG
jgi:hypothetical protein